MAIIVVAVDLFVNTVKLVIHPVALQEIVVLMTIP